MKNSNLIKNLFNAQRFGIRCCHYQAQIYLNSLKYNKVKEITKKCRVETIKMFMSFKIN